ncbi:t-SNARE [Dacryopinax primogenitus]|uniref:t-SNARE n=1 Tax=Dacryopinax primogenitus (strain DJM 731) TaxID=1858805 RepID=M5GD58_DACPD|nr:t-SNARE [Dacryopinax primogenitus]EJU04277.1 t-SNARE [Dacryopinax primogenitus]
MAEPVIRSRTNLFFSYRDSVARSSRSRRRIQELDEHYGAREDMADDEREGLIGLGDRRHVALDMETLPPKWVDVSDQVEDTLRDTAKKITELDKLQAKHVLPGFVDRSAEEREIEALSTDITRDFRRCHSLIQRISQAGASHTFPPTAARQQEQRMAVNVQRGLAAKVQDLSATFRKKQRVYMQKLQGHAIKNQDLLVASGAISLKGAESMTAVEDDLQASRSQLSGESQVQAIAAPDLDIAQRDRELTELAKSIGALAELFKDLSTLVIDQGTILDSVEYNIEQTATHVEEAVKELKVATQCVLDIFKE